MTSATPVGDHGGQDRIPRVPRTGGLRLAVVVVLALVVGTLIPGTAAAAPALPDGFSVQELPSGQAELLTDVAFLPDGSYVTTGKNGRVAWVSAAGDARTLAELPVVAAGDLGLTAVAVAPDFAQSRTVYLGRALDVDGQWRLRLSAWTVEGAPEPSSLTGERVVLELPATADVHGLTGLVAAADGTLWVTIGDSADFRFADPLALRALDVDSGYGKLLHVTPDGQGVAANPFFDAASPGSWRSRVYASGFRSPFRVSLDPGGVPILGDVGWSSWEEVDVVRPGASYGWPCWEGREPTLQYRDLPECQGVANTDPLWTYVHGPAGTSVTGGIVYTGESYPEEYRGAYFFGDYASQRVYTLRYDADGQLVREPEAEGFGVENGAPVRFVAADNGDIMWADIGDSTLKRLVYAPGNRPPTAQAAVTTDPATRTVTFDGGGSGDLDGDPLTYRWDFGDGSFADGEVVTHTYAEPGTTPVTASLTVTDPSGAEATTSFPVVPANGVPVIELSAPPPDQRFAVGELVRATATATDPEDGPLPVTWSVVLVHCSAGLCHDHPGESVEGPEYARPFVDHGAGTRLEITASATDSAGAVTRRTFVAEAGPAVLTLTAATG
ncbi:MAG TPA: PQQ-dependent sugar dehydrogenase [Geodermatophilus sp.]|nr:PQQ-dependent sugar dehydrogenase [Geodermatophilus sp.]